MDDAAVLAAIELDDSLIATQTLAERPTATTELVQRRSPREGEPKLLVRKRIPLSVANEDAWRRCREAWLAGEERLPHVRELYQLPDALVVVYDYIEGPTLEELVKQDGPLDATVAAGLVRQLAEALAPLHEAGVIHRDVTPANVVVASDGAHLLDLGIARVRSARAAHDTTWLGTYGYAAPEQYGFAQTDARSDIYSLGRVLGFALTGQVPGQQAWDEAIRGLTGRAGEVVRRATAFEPSARYQSARELARALARLEREPTAVADKGAEKPVDPAGEHSGPLAKTAAPEAKAATPEAGTSRAAKPASSRHHTPYGITSTLRALPLALGSLHGLRRLVALALLVLVAFADAAILVPTAGALFLQPQNPTDPASGVLVVALAAWAVLALAAEPALCLSGTGPYAATPGRLRIMCRRELWLLVTLVAVFVVLVVLVALFTGTS